mgnify:FL=1
MCGIGVIIIILQINPFLGVDGFGSIVYTLTHLFETIDKASYEAIIVASISLAIMFLQTL